MKTTAPTPTPPLQTATLPTTTTSTPSPSPISRAKKTGDPVGRKKIEFRLHAKFI